MIRKVLIALGITFLIGLVGVALAGFLSQPDYKSEMTRTYALPVDDIWRHLTDIATLPERRPEVKEVIFLPPGDDGLPRWKELINAGGILICEMVARQEKKSVSIRVVYPKFNYTQTTDYILEAVDSEHTKVTIRTQSRIENSAIRAMMVISGRDTALKQEHRLLMTLVKPVQ
ncbi:SRPBCC family protein [bacterium]|nr:SRPBCC family protein [bacterium]